MFVPSTTAELDSAFASPSIEELSEAEFLQIQDGRFVVASVERILGIPKNAILKATARFEKLGGRPDLEWGVCKIINRWVVQMPSFSKAWPNEIQPYIAFELGRVKSLPRKILVDELILLEGIFLLSELERYIPFSPQNIKDQVRKMGHASRKAMGCWQHDSEYLVDMQRFLKWVVNFKYS